MGQLKTDIQQIALLLSKDASASEQGRQRLQALEQAGQLFKSTKTQPDGWQEAIGKGARFWSEQAIRCSAPGRARGGSSEALRFAAVPYQWKSRLIME